MAQIIGAGTPVDIKLGQIPLTTNPQLRAPFQEMYNSLHILSQYLEALRAGLEGSDSQTPAENIRFLKFLTRPAKQSISAGQVCTVDFNDGSIIRGTSFGAVQVKTFNQNGQNYPYVSGMVQTFYGIAQKDAAVGELATIGIGPGILKVTGAVSGQQIYAAAAYGQTYQVSTTNISLFGLEPSYDGSLYLGNPEALRLPGYPKDVSSTLRILGHYMCSPIGIAVANDYVLFSDFLPWFGRTANSFTAYP